MNFISILAVTFEFDQDTSTGPTLNHARANTDWKNEDSVTDNFATFPITTGNFSFTLYQYGHFSGAYNQLESGLYAHTVGAFDANIVLNAAPTMTADGDRLAFATPATADFSGTLTQDITAVTAIASGSAVWFGITTPAAAAKAATTTAALPIYTNYLATQLEVQAGAPAGDLTASITLTLRYDES